MHREGKNLSWCLRAARNGADSGPGGGEGSASTVLLGGRQEGPKQGGSAPLTCTGAGAALPGSRQAPSPPHALPASAPAPQPLAPWLMEKTHSEQPGWVLVALS